MLNGQVFFVATTDLSPQIDILGFSSWRLEEGQHRTAIYVSGAAIRRGIGKALFRAAERIAIERSADEIHVDASLVAVDFYLANWFEKGEVREHTLSSGGRMACVPMRKSLSSNPFPLD